MSTISALLNVLKIQSDEAISDTLVALLESNDESVFQEIVEDYHCFSWKVREEIAGYAKRFRSALGELIKSENEQTRFNCIEFLSSASDLSTNDFSLLLGACVSDENPAVAQQAVDLMQNQVRTFFHRQGLQFQNKTKTPQAIARFRSYSDQISEQDAETYRDLLYMLGKALEAFPAHERNDVVDSLVCLGKNGEEVLFAFFKQQFGSKEASQLLLREITSRPRSTTLVLILSMLATPSAHLRRIASDAIKIYSKSNAQELFIETINLQKSEKARSIVRNTRSLNWIAQCQEAMNQINPETFLACIDEFGQAGLDIERKLQQLRSCLIYKDERVIAKIFRIFQTHYQPVLRTMLLELSEHGYEPVRFHALACLARSSFQGKNDLMRDQLKSKSSRIRGLAVQSLAQEHFDRFVKNFHTLNEQSRKYSAEIIKKIDLQVLKGLSKCFHSWLPEERVKGLMILRYTGVIPELQTELVRLIRDNDRQVRSLLPTLLAELKTTEASAALLNLLGDEDQRIRANAVEAIEDIGQATFQKSLIPLLRCPHPRLRANAAKALYSLGSKLALQILAAMAERKEPAQRLSALWALAHIADDISLRLAFQIARKEREISIQKRMYTMIDEAIEGRNQPLPNSQTTVARAA